MSLTPDTCLTHGVCNQHCHQGRTCPRVAGAQRAPMPTRVITLSTPTGGAATVAKVGNVHRLPVALHAQPDAWLTTPGQLERTDDEREGRVLTVYDALGTTGQVVALLLTIIIVGISSGYVATRWGDDIGHYVYQALLAWGRVWT